MPFDYNWGVHPSLAFGRGCDSTSRRPAGWSTKRAATCSADPVTSTTGPCFDGQDLRRADDIDVGAFALHYLTGLTAGWVAATDVADRRGFGLCFDHELFPVVWFCLVYGGWRGYRQALVEPWTGYPSPLDEAVAAGRARLLGPDETQSTEVVAALYDGVEAVTRSFDPTERCAE